MQNDILYIKSFFLPSCKIISDITSFDRRIHKSCFIPHFGKRNYKATEEIEVLKPLIVHFQLKEPNDNGTIGHSKFIVCSCLSQEKTFIVHSNSHRNKISSSAHFILTSGEQFRFLH